MSQIRELHNLVTAISLRLANEEHMHPQELKLPQQETLRPQIINRASLIWRMLLPKENSKELESANKKIEAAKRQRQIDYINKQIKEHNENK